MYSSKKTIDSEINVFSIRLAAVSLFFYPVISYPNNISSLSKIEQNRTINKPIARRKVS